MRVVVPRELEALLRLDALDDRAALVAVSPAEAAGAAGARVELDLVREPLGDAVGLRQRRPHLLTRDREHDLAPDLHDRHLLRSATSWLRI